MCSGPVRPASSTLVRCTDGEAEDVRDPEHSPIEEGLPSRWTPERVTAWYERLPWPLGCNFVPSTAVNPLEMWDASTFDPETIDRELGWAADLGFTMVRVFLHDLAWRADAAGLLARFDRFLEIAHGHGISTMPVFLDSCWNNYGFAGPQPDPIPGVHNSRWVQSPHPKIVVDRRLWDPLRDYVQGVMQAHRNDPRVAVWDLYNEPGNEGLVTNAMPLTAALFRWAREVDPVQPLTVGIWNVAEEFRPLNDLQILASDVLSFHWYEGIDSTRRLVDQLAVHGRPLLCTEYMARSMDSEFATHLPFFRDRGVGALHWGLVAGRSQTYQPWFSQPGDPEATPWFHDVLRPDGTPYDEAEARLLREVSPRSGAPSPN